MLASVTRNRLSDSEMAAAALSAAVRAPCSRARAAVKRPWVRYRASVSTLMNTPIPTNMPSATMFAAESKRSVSRGSMKK
jgi:hypothetical protein